MPTPSPSPSPLAAICAIDPFNIPDALAHHRYFNLPIEQIPQWDATKPQVLVHGATQGLRWQSVLCLDVVTWISLESGELKIERRNIPILAEFTPISLCSGIPTTACPTSSPSP